ncbi:pentapeptide repeat-containing protein [Neptuniibacter sp.]|uniref:pentapeptide repeat-containing protein n=1 Tax=Neptuniibacter sp. TaxID=1962643 RepID=UPI00260DB576|nr:pentapeptide repeat-containing protein [Neptuniibacter sp.]MCP4597023.1 pentapeptide repeat-containing protein [Neptuniibacter sp.]
MIEIKDFSGNVLKVVDADTLYGANLYGASLNRANLDGASLYGASLNRASLNRASLDGANLYGANLYGANLNGASLNGANLYGARLPHFSIVPEVGGFYAWKKTTKGICKIYIPADAERISSLVGRKCRASKIKIVSGGGCGGSSPTHTKQNTYFKGETYHSENDAGERAFDPDIRVECAVGIHFFLTKREAKEW